MNLKEKTALRLQHSSLSSDEQVMLCCARAKELEEAGHYEAARDALSTWWEGAGHQPGLIGLAEVTRAELLLRAGALTGRLGSAQQIANAQELAKNLISESISIFFSHGLKSKAGEAQTELAYCYWREGAFDEARILLREALRLFGDDDVDLRAWALLRMAIVERTSMRLPDALRILKESAALFETSRNAALKGNFHNTLALVLRNIASDKNHPEYLDKAIVEYTAASFYFEQAGHIRHRARVENNLGFLSLTLGRLEEAHIHLDRARQLFTRLKDSGSVAQVDESRARLLLTEGHHSEAERTARSSILVLERGDEQAILAEALTTRGIALARLERHEEACAALERALAISETMGDREGAGRAALTLIEELHQHLTRDRLSGYYFRADQLIADSPQTATLNRLRACARHVIDAQSFSSPQSFATTSPDAPRWSKKTATLIDQAHRVAEASIPVLITGEIGTGKEAIAKLIHARGSRRGKFFAINCAAQSEESLDSQLFGHRKGAFRGADEDYPGAVREAADGTLYLDAVDELSLTAQSKLLRLVDNGELFTLGAGLPDQVDVRVIAATNANLDEMVATGKFREALYYRLSGLRLDVAPLRERREDIAILARQSIAEMATKIHDCAQFTDESLAALQQLPLFGNAIELQALIQRLAIEYAGSIVTAEAVARAARKEMTPLTESQQWKPCDLAEEVRQFERRHVEQALRASGGRITHAARLLGFKHHQSLMTILNSRHRELLGARLPAKKRHRSIIRKNLKLVSDKEQ